MGVLDWSKKSISLITLLFAAVAICDGGNVGEWYNTSVMDGNMITVVYNITTDTSQAVRFTTISLDANLSQPIFVSVRQGRHITAWTIPYVEDGHAFLEVDRTLCPILNSPFNDNSSSLIHVDISTSTTVNLSVSLLLEYVRDYQLSLNTTVTTEVSAPSPVFYVFEYPQDTDHVLVTVTSDSTICAIVSIQDQLCPTDQLVDYPSHRGVFQTMEKLAAINIKRPTHQDFFYVVVSIYHDEECSQTKKDLIDGLITLNTSAQYNPVFFHDEGKFRNAKNVTIAIKHTLPPNKYWIGPLVSFMVFLSFYLITLTWIIIVDYFFYYKHKAYKFVEDLELRRLEEETQEQTDSGQTERRVTFIKRPSFLRVLEGSHWSKEVEKRTTPTCSPKNQDYIQKQFKEALLKQYRPRALNRSLSNPIVSPERSPLLRHMRSSKDETDGVVETKPTFAMDVVTETQAVENSINLEQVGEGQVLHSSHSHENASQTVLDTSLDNPQTETHTASHNNTHITDQTEHQDTLIENGQRESSPSSVSSSPAHSPVHSPAHSQRRRSSHLSLEGKKYMKDLNIEEGKSFQKKYEGYWAYLVAILLFYAIPSYQLFLTYQKYLHVSGNQDFCYYNTLCSHPLGVFSAFNNIYSNIGFLMLGFLFIIVARRRRKMYRCNEIVNENYDEKIGVPQHFGIYYAVGVALMGEAVMSAAYHICPTSSNYQYDTTMMFVLVTLGLYKLYECRNPDCHPSPHKLLITLAFLILLIGLGVLYSSSIIFYICFFIIFETMVIYITLQNYYRWVKLWPLSKTKEVIKELFQYNLRHPFPIQHKPKFIYLVIANIINFIGGVIGLICRPADFGTYFLFIMIANFLSSLIYYIVTKLCYKECKRHTRKILRPIIYLILSIVFFIGGGILYSRSVTNWLESPAGSRNNNQECILFDFFDTHDLWHFLSAFALFFAFLLLMTLDDDQELENRSSLHIF